MENTSAKRAIHLTGEPYFDGVFYRLPTEDGQDSVRAMQGSWLSCTAEDNDGNEFLVMWDYEDDDEYPGEIIYDAEQPTAVIGDPYGNAYDATASVTIEF